MEKGIRQSESDAEFVEVCFSALQQVKQKRNKQDQFERESYSRWLTLHQVVSLDTLLRKDKDMFGGCLCCTESQEVSTSGKSFSHLFSLYKF